MSTTTECKVMIVDDDDTLRSRLSRAFRNRGYEVFEADGYDTALTVADEHIPDRAVLDLRMPGKSGLELLQALKSRQPGIKSIVLTGYGSISNAVDAVKLGAVNYVTKPADADEILAAFERVDPNESAQRPDNYTPQSLAAAEWEHIQRVLADCGGNISEAARLLDIPRRTLQRKLKKLSP